MFRIASMLLFVAFMAAPASADLAKITAPDHKGRYKNAVLVGKTDSGKNVTLTFGTHADFPLAGIHWDNTVLKVGTKGYAANGSQDDANPALAIKMYQRPIYNRDFIYMKFDGKMTTDGLTSNVPVFKSDGSGKKSDVQMVVWATGESVNEQYNLPFLSEHNLPKAAWNSWRLNILYLNLKIDGKTVGLKEESFEGHIEKGDPMVLNIPDLDLVDRQPFFSVYDYEAAYSAGESHLGIVKAGLRLIKNEPGSFFDPDGVNKGQRVTPMFPMRGKTTTRTMNAEVISEVRIGKLVLQRQLVECKEYIPWFYAWFLPPAKQMYGMKEGWRFDPEPLPTHPSLKWLQAASERELAQLYDQNGYEPTRQALIGKYDGVGAMVSPAGLVRGLPFEKIFESGHVDRDGHNKFLKVLEIAPFKLTSNTAKNRMDLKYDIPANALTPFRLVRDTLRQVSPDVFVGQMFLRIPGDDAYLGMFAIHRK